MVKPQIYAEVLACIHKHKKAVMCFMEKRHVLGKFYSGVCYSAVGHDFNVNESTLY